MANRLLIERFSNSEYLDDLVKVTTVREVMELYKIPYASSVIWLINRGDICATKVYGTWLISLDSVVAWFGKPRHIDYP